MLLLHLSDIHFRKGEVGTAMDPNAHLRNELLRDAEAQCKRIGVAPDAVLISGDIAFAGDPEEYVYATRWLDELCQRCGTTLAAIFIVPGNHDVVRSIASRPLVQSVHREIKNTSDVTWEGVIRGLLTNDETARLLYEGLAAYNAFAGQFFCDLLPPERTIAKRDLVFNDGSLLRLAGLNSAFVSSSADKAGDLFVDPACFQLQRVPGVEYLVLCHHPYSWLRQGDALRDYLGDVGRVHLFGHEHTNRIEVGRDWVRVAASAAHPDKTEAGWEPGYNLIELRVDGEGTVRNLEIDVHVRVWQQRPGEFRTKTDRGRDTFHQRIGLDSWGGSHAAGKTSQPNSTCSSELVLSDERQEVEADAMDSLREISIRFFKLTLSQKSAIAGKLDLLEEEDANQPDFEKFRRVFLRAKERGKIEALDKEIKAIEAKN